MKSTFRYLTFFIVWSVIGTFNSAAQALYGDLLEKSKLESDPIKKCNAYIFYLEQLGNIANDSAYQLLTTLEKKYQEDGFVYGFGRAKSLNAWLLIGHQEYLKSIQIAKQALVYQSKSHDTLGMAQTIARIGVGYSMLDNFNLAEKHFTQSYVYFKQCNDTQGITSMLNNLGDLHFENREYLNATFDYKRLLDIQLVQNDYLEIGNAYYNLGNAYLQIHKLDSAKCFLKLSQNIIQKSILKKAPAKLDISLGRCFYEESDFKNALHFTQLGIQTAIDNNQPELQLQGNLSLSKTHEKMGNFKEAISIQNDILILNSYIDSVNCSNKLFEAEEKYQEAYNEAELVKLELIKLDAENKLQTFRVYGISIICVLLISIGVIVIIRERKRFVQRTQQENNTE